MIRHTLRAKLYRIQFWLCVRILELSGVLSSPTAARKTLPAGRAQAPVPAAKWINDPAPLRSVLGGGLSARGQAEALPAGLWPAHSDGLPGSPAVPGRPRPEA